MEKVFTNLKRKISILATICMIFTLMPASAFAVEASDISNHWAKGTIQSWISANLIKGYEDGTFKPDNNISRAEFMSLVNNAFGYKEMASMNYTDVKADDWYANVVAKAKAAGYISGYPDGTMKPNDPISREEAAIIIMKINKLSENFEAANKFTDAASIANWSKGAVGAVVNAKIMNGYPDGSFSPRNLIKRGEATVALDGAMQYISVPTALAAPSVTRNDDTNKVTGMTTLMEYKLDATNWVMYKSTVFNALDFSGNHTLLVRFAATGTSPVSQSTTLTFTTNAVISGGGGGGSSSIAVSAVALTSSAIIITTDNGELQMIAEITPAAASIKTVTWSVINGTGEATISNMGLLKAVKDGTVTVKATSVSNPTVNNTLVITISGQKSDAKAITIFSFEGVTPAVLGVINENAKTIALTVLKGTDLTGLVATFTNSPIATVKVGDNVQTSGTTLNDFTNPVSYLVTAEDGTTVNYTVTVAVAVDKSELTNAISAANTNKTSAVVSTDGRDVLPATSWVTQQVKTAYLTAITTAQAVVDKANATQIEVDNAVLALATAEGTFDTAKKDGTWVNTESIDTAINQANTTQLGVAISLNGTDVVVGKDWVTQAVKDALASAIVTATTVKTTATTDLEVTNAVSALNTAVSTYNNAKQDGTWFLDKSSIDTSISAANDAKTGVVINADGTDVAPGTYWVTQAVKDALDAAILTATNAKATVETDQDVLNVVNTLNTAKATYISAKKDGIKQLIDATFEVTMYGPRMVFAMPIGETIITSATQNGVALSEATYDYAVDGVNGVVTGGATAVAITDVIKVIIDGVTYTLNVTI